jgi:hypothetical protein
MHSPSRPARQQTQLQSSPARLGDCGTNLDARAGVALIGLGADLLDDKRRNNMVKRPYLFALLLPLVFLSVSDAQQFPIMDVIANKIIQKYQQSTCEQLWQKKKSPSPKSAEEQNVIQILKNDPQMRTAFINEGGGAHRQQNVRVWIDSLASTRWRLRSHNRSGSLLVELVAWPTVGCGVAVATVNWFSD